MVDPKGYKIQLYRSLTDSLSILLESFGFDLLLNIFVNQFLENK